MLGDITEWPVNEYNRKRRPSTRHRRPHREKLQTAAFVAWDGEGYSTEDGIHHYMLFGNSIGDSVKGSDLTWRNCFPLLLQPRDEPTINVIFGGDYDVIMMTKTMPWPVRERLFKGLAVRYDGYRMQWFRRKYLLLTDVHKRRSTVLYDVHSFFQCSFVNACKEYLGDDETLQAMHLMKLRRDSFTKEDADVDSYWKDELAYLVRLCDVLRGLLADVDIRPRGWYGPGAVASALMKLHGMGQFYRQEIPDDIVDLAERAYYGGRFEQFKVGKIGQVYEYDIRSAYPKAITLLPDFATARWHHEDYEHSGNPSEIRRYALYCVSWNVEFLPHQMGPLPWRDSTGRIFYPLKGFRSWYWGIEIENCLTRSLPPDMYTIHEAQIPEFHNTVRPFSWVEEMYEDRARMKREGNPAQKALKLGLNSLYGKLAQSTGSRKREDGWLKPKWHNALWAGWVTAFTRASIFDAVRKQRHSLVAIETDAVFVTSPITEISLGERLGEWEQTDIEQILYVHSGIYYALNRGVWKLKSRGIEADKSKSADHWLDIFSRLPNSSVEITMRLRRFGTDIRQPARFGNWFDHVITTVMPNAFSKRMHRPELCPTCIATEHSYADRFHYLVVPQGAINSDYTESQPYKFPWREDVTYSWPAVIKSEAIELPEELAWV